MKPTTDTEIWKSRANAHEENYNEMLKRVDQLVAENKSWKAEAKLWLDMYIQYDDILEKDTEKAKARITNVIAKIKSLDKEINNKH